MSPHYQLNLLVAYCHSENLEYVHKFPLAIFIFLNCNLKIIHGQEMCVFIRVSESYHTFITSKYAYRIFRQHGCYSGRTD